MKMENKKIGLIVCAVVCALFMGLAGCHNKKKIAPKQEVAAEERDTIPLRPADTSPTLGAELDSSTFGGETEPAIEPIVELVEEALEEKAGEEQTLSS